MADSRKSPPKVAVITGASSGIGAATTQMLAASTVCRKWPKAAAARAFA